MSAPRKIPPPIPPRYRKTIFGKIRNENDRFSKFYVDFDVSIEVRQNEVKSLILPSTTSILKEEGEGVETKANFQMCLERMISEVFEGNEDEDKVKIERKFGKRCDLNEKKCLSILLGEMEAVNNVEEVKEEKQKKSVKFKEVEKSFDLERFVNGI